jgi:hypothetical protein
VIVRILHEGQYRLDGNAIQTLKDLDRDLVARLGQMREGEFSAAYGALLNVVRDQGSRLPDEEIVESDLILPPADIGLEEAQGLFRTQASP